MLAALLLSTACGDDEGSADTSDESSSSDGTTAPTTTNASVTDPTVADSSESSGTPTSTETTESSTATETTSTETTDSTGTETTESSDGSTTDGSSSSETTANDTANPACDCDAGEYCDWPDNECGGGQDAVCLPMPQFCPEIFAPVCGCDGQTYGNDCEAAAAGVDVDYDGECEGGNACECGPGEYCDWPDDQCGDGEAGECLVMPELCIDIFDPVCGCDGQTYSNECYANAAGVDVAYAGECEGGNACACGPGEYCALPEGQCDQDGGVCMLQPEICPAVFAPVCGCDGMTYSNSCVAASMGQNVDYDGEC